MFVPKVLIVDDEELLRDLIESVLAHDGIESTATESIQGARDAVQKMGGLDLAIVDKNLPDGTGLDLVREFQEKFPAAEFIMVTGYASLESAMEAVEIGLFDYLTKPFEVPSLQLKITNALEKVRLGQERRRGERLYRGLFAGATDGLIIFDPNNDRVLDANPAALELYGRSIKDMWELTRQELIVRDNADIREGSIVPQWHLGPEGEFPAEVAVSLVDVGGETVGIMAVRDITAREALGEQLREAEKMNALGRLAGGIANAFNNLLLTIQSASNLLVGDFEPNDSRLSLVSEIHGTAERGVGLTQQLMSFSRNKPATLSALNLNQVLEGMTPMLKRTLGDRVKLKLELDSDLVAISGNPDQFAQILANIVTNAAESMHGTGALIISTQNEARIRVKGDSDGPSRVACLRVIDSGTGMDEMVRERVFEPFYTTKPGSAGLGMAVVYGLVNQVGGEIRIDSAFGKGTCVELRFPERARARATTGEVRVRPMTGKVRRKPKGPQYLPDAPTPPDGIQAILDTPPEGIPDPRPKRRRTDPDATE